MWGIKVYPILKVQGTINKFSIPNHFNMIKCLSAAMPSALHVASVIDCAIHSIQYLEVPKEYPLNLPMRRFMKTRCFAW